jgi:hypothetical protein
MQLLAIYQLLANKVNSCILTTLYTLYRISIHNGDVSPRSGFIIFGYSARISCFTFTSYIRHWLLLLHAGPVTTAAIKRMLLNIITEGDFWGWGMLGGMSSNFV